MKRVLALAAIGAAVFASSALARSDGGSTTVVDYGKSITLKASVPGGGAGGKVTVAIKPCAFTAFATFASPPVSASGAVAYKVGPTMNTIYKVLSADRPVATFTVQVRPAIAVKRLSPGHIQVTVTTGNGQGLGGRRVAIQQRTSSGHWKTVQTIPLKLTSRIDEIDAVATGAGVVHGTNKVRAVLSAVQAKPCFAAATSPAA
ncbi:MAG: hypothetical protein ACRDL2_03780 [Gaiellaceae bacterium]